MSTASLELMAISSRSKVSVVEYCDLTSIKGCMTRSNELSNRISYFTLLNSSLI